MTTFLRQSTASQEVVLGRFVDSTDGNTEETGLTINNTDIDVWKTGATTLADKNSGGATHIANGVYYCVLDATDTNTIGPLELHVHVSGALYVKKECVVLDEAVYDVLFGTTAPSTLAGTAQTGDCYARLGAPAGASVSADVAAVKSDTAAILVDTGTTLDGRIPAALVGGRMDASVGAVAAGAITAAGIADGAIDAATFAAGAIDAAAIAANAIGASELAADAVAEIADAIWEEAQADHVGAGTFGEVATEVAAILSDTGTDGVLISDGSGAGQLDLVSGKVLIQGTKDQIDDLNDLSAAGVNAEVVDALATDTYAEPAQGAPAATTTLAVKIGHLYKNYRNKKTQTATTWSLFNDDEATVDHKATVSDNGTTATKGEVATGP